MKLHGLTPEHFALVQEHLTPYISQLADRFPDDWPVEALQKQVEEKIVVPWMIWDEEKGECFGMALTEVGTKHSGRKAMSIHVTGREPLRWVHLIDELEQHGRDNGCDFIELLIRHGWKWWKPPNYRKEGFLRLTKELANG